MMKATTLDRRTFLKTTGASPVLIAPATLDARLPDAVPDWPSSSDQTARKKQAMTTGGLSKARLGRMQDVMAGYVERGDVPGIVTLVSRRGEVHVDANRRLKRLSKSLFEF